MNIIKRNRKGAGLVEYALLTGLVSVVAIASVVDLGAKVASIYDETTSALAGDDPEGIDGGSVFFAILEPQSFFMSAYAEVGDNLGRVATRGTSENFEISPADAGVSINKLGQLAVSDANVFGAPGARRVFEVTAVSPEGARDQAEIDVSREDGTGLVHVIGSTSRERLATSSEVDRWLTQVDRNGRHVQFNLFPATAGGDPGEYLDLDMLTSDDELLGGGRGQFDAWAVVNNLSEGRNFIDISGYRSTSAGGYEFNSRYVDDIPDEWETGRAYEIGETASSDILLGDTGDVFKFSTDSVTDLVVRGRSDDAGGNALPDFDLRLSDADDPQSHTSRREDMRSVNAVNGYGDFIYNDLPAGNYFLRMEGSGSTDEGDYAIETEGVDDPGSDWPTAHYAWPTTERGFSVISAHGKFFAENDKVDTWCYNNPSTGGKIDWWSGHSTSAMDGGSDSYDPPSGDASWLEISIFQVDKGTGAKTAIGSFQGKHSGTSGLGGAELTIPSGEIFFTVERYRTRSQAGGYTLDVNVGASERQPEVYNCQG